ncbi:1-acyl-sn-glycerol-3-phosphate acyltransferase [Hahella sp. CCB-MM4]|uniref:lysophospholipid acyltransferase family protein n=1 Tax=Hahella sp. (strain CCB-MM4) TaxID=1926491 RepID=UPI000B9AE937|nr:lysophospholipid acyltransferase family protein [Hahella sp. CCB-MM4]OZG71811.1 1-acyl-sn-glycerol-3-phosphate acyltransferase [Hahella sp. CCB-MM4]
MKKIIGIIFLLFITLTSVALFAGALVLWLLTRWFDHRLVYLHRYTCFWAYLYVWSMPAWQVSFIDRHKINPRRTYVVVSNHQSLLDILVVFGLFFHFKWVSKAEIFQVPLIGWNMVLNRYVKLKRGDAESIGQMMSAAETHLKGQSSVYLFPEGTRSFDGRLKSFKPGAFILAKKLGLPILPIVIEGTTHALPKHSLEFHGRHPICVKVMDTIEPESFAQMSDTELAEYTRRKFAEELARLRHTSVDQVVAPCNG